MEILLLFLAITIVCLFLDIPIAFAIGISTLILIILEPNFQLDLISQTLFSSTDSFPLLAIPFFVLAGEIMSVGGMAKRLVNFVQNMVGSLTGSVGIITILASAIFAAITGSGPATVASIGGMMIPYMIKEGYKPSYAGSIAATSGTLGPIIPPSIIFIVYGVVAGVSIGDMFIAGIVPGALMVVALLVLNYLISKREGYTKKSVSSEKNSSFLKELNHSKWALLAPIIILGGIYGGVVTPTEASIIGVVYSLIICVFVYKELKVKDLANVFLKATSISGSILIFVGIASVFGKYITLKQIPQELSLQITNITDNPILILLIINVFLLIVGMFMETIAAILIFVPLLLPIALSVGVDPLHFGIIVCINLSIGMITPPFGINLFIGSKIAKIPFEKTFPYLKWSFLALIIVLMVITYIPGITLFLPNLLS